MPIFDNLPLFMYKAGILILLLGMTKIAVAQPRGVSLWFTGQIPVSFSKKWQWQNDLIYKSAGTSAKAYQRFYRTGIRYEFSDDWNVAGGVGFFSTLAATNKDDDEFGKEFRFWQDLNYQHEVNKALFFQNRFRTEERFLKATSQKKSSHIFNLNDKVSFTKPVSDKWDIQLADELFEQVINKKLIFNQNRLIGMGIYNITKNMQVQGGYIWVLRKTFSQHVIQFTIKKMFRAYGGHDHSSE